MTIFFSSGKKKKNGALPLSYRAFVECAEDPISIYFNFFRKIFGQKHPKISTIFFFPQVLLLYSFSYLIFASEFAMSGALPRSYRAFIECREDPISIYFNFFRKIFGQKHPKITIFFSSEILLLYSFSSFLRLSPLQCTSSSHFDILCTRTFFVSGEKEKNTQRLLGFVLFFSSTNPIKFLDILRNKKNRILVQNLICRKSCK